MAISHGKFLYSVGLILLLLNCFKVNAQLIETKETEPAVYKLVTGDNYYPFVSSNVPQGGWSSAIIMAVFEKMQKPVHIDSLPWTRGFQWALEGQYRGTFPYVHTDERAKYFYYSEPINTVPVRIYVAAHSPITEISDLNKKTLCLPFGYRMDSWSKQFFASYNFIITHANNARGCASKVLKNWSDFGFINGYFSEQQLMTRFGSLDGIRILEQKAGLIPLHFIVSKNIPGAQQLIKQFNRAFAELTTSGHIAKIDQAYINWLNGLAFSTSQ